MDYHPDDLSCDSRSKWMVHMFRISAFQRDGILLKGVGKAYYIVPHERSRIISHGL
jgi:hypothetical protein